MDLSKLTPAPWCPYVIYVQPGSWFTYVPHVKTSEEASLQSQFIALARLAFDIRMRRHWYSLFRPAGWYGPAGFYVYDQDEYELQRKLAGTAQCEPGYFRSDDPDNCLVEADAWYKEKVENAGPTTPGQ